MQALIRRAALLIGLNINELTLPGVMEISC